MSRSSLSALAFMLAQVPIGLALAALRSLQAGQTSYFLYYQILYTLIVVTLGVSAIAARYRGPFWFGFSVAGWVYFALALWNSSQNLVTTRILENLAMLAYAREMGDDSSSEPNIVAVAHVGHLILTLVIATAGGFFATALELRRTYQDEPEVPSSHHWD